MSTELGSDKFILGVCIVGCIIFLAFGLLNHFMFKWGDILTGFVLGFGSFLGIVAVINGHKMWQLTKQLTQD
jgi:hypothetical protein